MLRNTLSYASMGRQGCLSGIGTQKDIKVSLMTMKTTIKRQKPKIQWKSAREKCRSLLNHIFFSENFIYDPLNFFTKPMGAINIKIM